MHSLTHSFIHKHSFIHSFIIQITYMLGSNCEPLQCTYVQVGPQMNVNNLAQFSFHLTFCGQHICIHLIWTYIMLLLCILQGLLPRKEESPSPTEQHSTEVATPRHHRDSVFDLILRKSPIPQPQVPPQHRPIGTMTRSKSSDGRRVSIFTVFAVSLEIHNCSTPRVSNWRSDNKYYQMCKHDTKALDCGCVIVVRGQPHPCPHPKISISPVCCYRAIGSWNCV